eukprot:COSAG02_NODE_4090_length_5801_cov_22.812347_2_plen_173_part_00
MCVCDKAAAAVWCWCGQRRAELTVAAPPGCPHYCTCRCVHQRLCSWPGSRTRACLPAGLRGENDNDEFSTRLPCPLVFAEAAAGLPSIRGALASRPALSQSLALLPLSMAAAWRAAAGRECRWRRSPARDTLAVRCEDADPRAPAGNRWVNRVKFGTPTRWVNVVPSCLRFW